MKKLAIFLSTFICLLLLPFALLADESSKETSKNQSFEIVFTSDVADFKERFVRALLEKAFRDLSLRFGVEFQATVTVVVGRSIHDLYNTVSNHQEDADFDQFNFAYQDQCRRNVGGFANSNIIVICFYEDFWQIDSLADFYTYLGNSSIKRDAQEIATHELFHVFQFRSSKVHGLQDYDKNPRFGIPGPYWLLEGSALYVGLRSVYTSAAINVWMNALEEDNEKTPPYCDVMKFNSSSFDSSVELTTASILMILQLVSQSSEGHLAKFYNEVGESGDWKVAFEGAFGEVPDLLFSCDKRNID